MARFVGERLGADAAARAAYLESDGFCLPHLRMVMPHVDPATAEALADDAQRRLGTLGGRLSEYRRKRDYRNAAEPRGDEQRSAIDATWRYARRPHADAGRGEPPDAG